MKRTNSSPSSSSCAMWSLGFRVVCSGALWPSSVECALVPSSLHGCHNLCQLPIGSLIILDQRTVPLLLCEEEERGCWGMVVVKGVTWAQEFLWDLLMGACGAKLFPFLLSLALPWAPFRNALPGGIRSRGSCFSPGSAAPAGSDGFPERWSPLLPTHNTSEMPGAGAHHSRHLHSQPACALLCFLSDPGTGPRVSGLHGPAGL